MARMRTLDQTAKYFKNQDPDTAVTKNWLYQMVRSGIIPSHKAGNRYLLNLDVIEKFLSNPPQSDDSGSQNEYGKLRRIEV
ncbi:MAG: DNA-binding protein [Bacillota bacterium]